MNAKKIMGAVLVALLAAALFVGAGAAATEDKGAVFVYQDLTTTDLDGTWTADKAVVTIEDGVVMAGANFAPGTYTKGDWTLYVTYPTATYFATVGTSSNEYIVKDTVYLNEIVNFTAVSASANMSVNYVDVYYENEAPYKVTLTGGVYNISANKLGSYKAVAHFTGNIDSFVGGTPVNYEYDTINALTFKVVKSDDVQISASVDTVLVGGAFTITVTGVPGQTFGIKTDAQSGDFTFSGKTVTSGNNQVTIPNTGVATVYVTATNNIDAGNYEIDIYEVINSANDASIDIEVIEGTITATAEKPSYYIGNDIKLNGTTTAGDTLFVYIAGTNFKFVKLVNVTPEVNAVADTWEAKIKAADFKDATGKKPDAGTYAIYISTNGTANAVADLDDSGVYATTTVSLIQPFIALTSAPEVVVQGDVAKFVGTAEATNSVAYYIFGTNYFAFSNTTSVKDGEFTVKIDKDDTKKMAAGQYFAVFQHKMYDGEFNIWANETSGEVFYAPTTKAGILDTAKVIFNVNDRQTANAAQALCDALDSQDIDDMYVKASFIVAAGTSIINPIPEEITKGSELTISGTTTGHVGDIVTVEMLSTAFAAVPKETVGSASFIALTTKVAEDGTWEVTFDTSGLNVDEYTVSVAVGALDGATTTKINVVEGAETPDTPDTPDVPDTPDTPDTPTEPTTPGFGALAALAGLGAVAVLLLRRE